MGYERAGASKSLSFRDAFGDNLTGDGGQSLGI